MTTSKKGIDLIKQFEGFRSEAYLCPANVWTIGYGTTLIYGKPVPEGLIITESKAEEYLKEDVKKFEESVNKYVKVQLNQNMFDALVSFTYNVGAGNFKQSTLLRLLNENKFIQAADQFPKWNKGGGKVLPGLVKRREAERKLFLEVDMAQEIKDKFEDVKPRPVEPIPLTGDEESARRV